MLFRTKHNDSRATGLGKGTTRASKRATIEVEPLEGRRLMDAAASAGLSASAQAHAKLAIDQHVELQSTLSRARAQVTAQTQHSLSLLSKAEHKLVVVIAKETQKVKTVARGSATFAAHARVLAQAKAQLNLVNGLETTLPR